MVLRFLWNFEKHIHSGCLFSFPDLEIGKCHAIFIIAGDWEVRCEPKPYTNIFQVSWGVRLCLRISNNDFCFFTDLASGAWDIWDFHVLRFTLHVVGFCVWFVCFPFYCMLWFNFAKFYFWMIMLDVWWLTHNMGSVSCGSQPVLPPDFNVQKYKVIVGWLRHAPQLLDAKYGEQKNKHD